MIYHKIQITIKQDSYTKANESGEEAQKETMRLMDIGLPQSKNKVNSNSTVRPGTKVKCNEGKYKLTNYIDWVDKIWGMVHVTISIKIIYHLWKPTEKWKVRKGKYIKFVWDLSSRWCLLNVKRFNNLPIWNPEWVKALLGYARHV